MTLFVSVSASDMVLAEMDGMYMKMYRKTNRSKLNWRPSYMRYDQPYSYMSVKRYSGDWLQCQSLTQVDGYGPTNGSGTIGKHPVLRLSMTLTNYPTSYRVPRSTEEEDYSVRPLL